MVGIGSVELDVGINRNSINSAIADLRRRFDAIESIEINAKVNTNPVAQGVQSIKGLFNRLDAIEIESRLNTSGVKQAVEEISNSATRAENTVELKASLNAQQLLDQVSRLDDELAQFRDVEIKVSGDVAQIEQQLQRTRDQIARIEDQRIVLNAQITTNSNALIDLQRKLSALKDEEIRLTADGAEASAELDKLRADISKLELQEIRIRANTSEAQRKLEGFDTNIRALQSRELKLGLDANQAIQQLQRFDRALEEAANGGNTSELKKVAQEIRGVGGAAGSAAPSLNSLGSAFDIFTGNLAADLLLRVADGIRAIAGAAVDTVGNALSLNRELLGIENGLSQVLGSSDAAAAELAFLDEVAGRTGANLGVLRSQYLSISAAAQGTAVSQESIREVFDAVSGAAATLGLNSETTSRAFTALSQIAAKGTVSMEELRGQLGEALPNALTAASQGLGLTQGELIELVSAGQLSAAEFFPALAEGLRATTGEASRSAVALGTLDNTLAKLGESVGGALEPIETAFNEAVASIVSGIDESSFDALAEAGQRLGDSIGNNPELVERLGAALNSLVASGSEAVALILDRINEALSNPENIDSFAQSIERFGQSLVEISTQTIDTVNAVFALIDALERLGLAKGINDGDKITVGFDGEFDGPLSQFVLGIADRKNLRVPVTFDGEFNGPLSQLLGIADREALEVPVAIETEDAQSGINSLANAIANIAGNTSGTSAVAAGVDAIAQANQAAEVSAEELAKAQADALKEIQSTNQTAIAELELTQAESLRAINEQQLSGADPSKIALDRIAAEQSAAQQIIEIRQQQIDELDAAESAGTIAADAAAKERISLEKALSQALDAELQARVARAEELAKAQADALKEIQSANQTAIAELELLQAESLRAINEQQLSGADPGQIALDRIAAEQSAAQQIIEIRQQQIDELDAAESAGTIAAEAAAEERLNLEKALSQALDAELQARIARAEELTRQQVQGIQAQFAELGSVLDADQASIGIQEQGLAQQLQLLSAQAELQETIAAGVEAETQGRIDAATAAGDFQSALQGTAQLEQQRTAALLQSQAIAQQVLGIEQEQRRLQSQGAALQAELNRLKAEEAVLVAQAEGADESRIGILERSLNIARQQEQAAGDAVAALERLEAIEVSNQAAEFANAQAAALREAEKAQRELEKQAEEASRKRIEDAERVADAEKAVVDAELAGIQQVAQARAQAISGLFGAISQQSSTSNEESLAQIEAAQDRLDVARRAGFFRGQEGTSAAQDSEQALRAVERLISRNASDQQLANFAFQNQDNEAALEALRVAGRGDIAALADAEQGFGAISTAIEDAQLMLGEKLDTLADIQREVSDAIAGLPGGQEEANNLAQVSTPSLNAAIPLIPESQLDQRAPTLQSSQQFSAEYGEVPALLAYLEQDVQLSQLMPILKALSGLIGQPNGPSAGEIARNVQFQIAEASLRRTG